MSEPTEQISERDRNNALMITNLQAEVDRLTIDRDAWRLTARTFERASAAAPRQASAMSAEADRIHVRLLAMGWLDHREDNCKTATEAAKLIRELSEESAPRQAEGWQPISSAPKDGTEIWLGREGRLILGYWSGKRGWMREGLQGEDERVMWEATHWQPHTVPEPPAAVGETPDQETK